MNTLNKSYIIETERLKLSLIQQNDLDAVFETMNSKKTADIISFLNWPMTKQQAALWCDRSVKGFEKQTDFLFLARDKNNISPIGCICLLLSEDKHEGEIGYWVTEKSQGLGFATEMLKAIVDLAFNTLCLKTVLATAAIENPESLRVLEKQGFRIIGFKDLPTAKGTILKCHLLSKVR